MENITQEMIDKWNKQIAYLTEHQDKLSEWELGFVDSMSMNLSKKDKLSWRESKKLREIYNKVGNL